MKRKFPALTFLIVLATAIAIAQAPTNSQSSQQNVPGHTAQSETQSNNAGSISGNTSPTNNTPATQAPAAPEKSAQPAPGALDTNAPSPDQTATPQTQPANAYSGTPTSTVVDSATLKGQLESAFQAEPTLSGASIQVNVSDSMIDLTGSVPSGKEKVTARRIAQSYAGNRKVADHITILSKGTPAPTASPSPK